MHSGPLCLHHRAECLSQELLKNQGYATGQFGKNHLGDLNKYLPTVHGFDEFYGNLYHLDAEEEPEMGDYPPEKDFPNFRKNFGPRGVVHSWATDKGDPTEEPRWGRVGKQRIEDTGPLTAKRMETCDDDFVTNAKDFIKRQNAAGKPFFVWLNTTHVHLFTHTPIPKIRYWVIFNNQFRPVPQITAPNWPAVIQRSLETSTRAATATAVRHLFAMAEISRLKRKADVEVRLVSIPGDWFPPKPGTFIKETMNNLADLGEEMGADPAS